MGKLAVIFITLAFILSSCSVETLEGEVNEIVAHANANYIEYSQDAVKNTQGDKVLFFHASWCGPCKSTNQKISEIETTTGLTVFKVDYDSSSELRKKYNVTSQHTFVQVDSEGNMLATWGGSKDIDDIKSQLVSSPEAKEMVDDTESKMEGNETIIDDMEMIESEDSMSEENDDMMDEHMDDSQMIDKETMSDSTDEMMNTEESMIKEEGKYITYSPEAVATTTGTKVLFFHATWCPNCIASDKAFNAEATPEGLNLFKVDYDTYTDLKKKYGVLTQTTFVQIDDNGEMLNRWFGSRNYAEILAELK